MNLNNLVLRPNCLMTKSPLIFVPGPRSLLFYKKPFGILPEFLFEHGYQTLVLPLPFQGKARRQQALQEWLASNNLKNFHFIADHTTYHEFSNIALESQTLSVTVITSSETNSNPPIPKTTYFLIPNNIFQNVATPLSFRVHQVFCWLQKQPVTSYARTFSNSSRQTLDRFLDHCIKLAENEFNA